MKIVVKLFATLRLNLKIGMVEIHSNSPISVLQLLQQVSKNVNSDILTELTNDNKILVGAIILIDGINVLHQNKLETIIDKDCVVSVFPPNAGG